MRLSILLLKRITCTAIPGDGVGPELVRSVQNVYKAMNVPIDFQEIILSEIKPKESAPLEDVIKSIEKNRVCLKSMLAVPEWNPQGDLQNLNMKLIHGLNLFAKVVHIKSLEGIKTRHKAIDLVVVRELSEGEYKALEHETVKGVVECLKIVTMKKSYQIAKFAFDYAMNHRRKKVTVVHKANIMKLGDGLFLQCCKQMSHFYPWIKFDSVIVDNCTMQMVQRPEQYDVLVTPNLYGTIICNLAAGLVGGASVTSGSSFANRCALFEIGVNHTFSAGEGKNIANPAALLVSSANLLRYVNLPLEGDAIQSAVEEVIKKGDVKTKDIGGSATTAEFTEAIIHELSRNRKLQTITS